MKWYEDPVYHLMCEKAVEIQKIWKPFLNDFIFSKEKGKFYSVNDCADGEYFLSS